ncbi:S-layer homology domain-containing protein [Gudongella sp. DL1XJH-153]|uniref:S-layer homology domain-containing protein n=1 Tax=Gudongella sp. DL1XJH-153 TaxID=3409804 RepID=UPI003BB6F3E4
MNKKTLSILMALVLIIASGSTVFGDIQDKLDGHWAENTIDKTFASHYFPYLARDDFQNFQPDSEILRESFTLSLASLCKEEGYTVLGIETPGALTRKAMVRIIGNRLMEIGLDSAEGHSLPFMDISSMDNEAINSLKLLHREGIVKGESNSVFNPGRNLTQAEAIIVLQRTQSAIRGYKEIEFRTLGVTQNYTNQEEVVTRVSDNVVNLVITKEFPTPGYTISVENILREDGYYKVHFKITPPDPDTILAQVITYKTITIEISKEELGEPPYDFVVEGFRDM